jgi:hypothetical protein
MACRRMGMLRKTVYRIDSEGARDMWQPGLAYTE